MGDHSDVPPWTRRILPLNFYTKFFRADVFYRIMTEREKERKNQMEEKKRRERRWEERERERKRVERRHGRQDEYISLVVIRARARENERNREREGRDGNSPDIGKAGPE